MEKLHYSIITDDYLTRNELPLQIKSKNRLRERIRGAIKSIYETVICTSSDKLGLESYSDHFHSISLFLRAGEAWFDVSSCDKEANQANISHQCVNASSVRKVDLKKSFLINQMCVINAKQASICRTKEQNGALLSCWLQIGYREARMQEL